MEDEKKTKKRIKTNIAAEAGKQKITMETNQNSLPRMVKIEKINRKTKPFPLCENSATKL